MKITLSLCAFAMCVSSCRDEQTEKGVGIFYRHGRIQFIAENGETKVLNSDGSLPRNVEAFFFSHPDCIAVLQHLKIDSREHWTIIGSTTAQSKDALIQVSKLDALDDPSVCVT